jgi:hypothetical protein
MGKYTRALSGQQLSKHVPVKQTQHLLLGSRFLVIQQLDYNNGSGAFSMWSMPKGYKGKGARLQLSRFCMEVCEERTSVHEAEESPLLEAAARKRLVKTQQDGKDLPCSDL